MAALQYADRWGGKLDTRDGRRTRDGASAAVECRRSPEFRRRKPGRPRYLRTDSNGRDIWDALDPENQELRRIAGQYALTHREIGSLIDRPQRTVRAYMSSPLAKIYRPIPKNLLRLLQLELELVEPRGRDLESIRDPAVRLYDPLVRAFRGG